MDKIQQLILQRKQEAADKELPKKIRCIAQFAGRKIIDQGETSYDEWEMMTQEIFERDESLRQIGWLFSGLPMGRECEILYLTELETLTVNWYSATVYKEVEGQVVSYYPHPKWETFVEDIYTMAKDREEMYFLQKADAKQKDATEKTNKFLGFLKKNWGIDFNF